MLISSDKPEKQGSKQFLPLKYFWSVKDYPTFSNIFVSRIGNNKTEVGGLELEQGGEIFYFLTTVAVWDTSVGHCSVRNVR